MTTAQFDGDEVTMAAERRYRVALAGAPNCGKSTLFNGLTGGRAKVANYPGATVETRKGRFATPAGRGVELVDLPGFYGLTPRSMDERISVNFLKGAAPGEAPPDAVLVVIDAANLRTHLHSVLQLRRFDLPMVVVLNMFDLAERDGLEIDLAALSDLIDAPVVTCRATRKSGRESVVAALDTLLGDIGQGAVFPSPPASPNAAEIRDMQREARAIAGAAITREPIFNQATRHIDAVVLHPVAGPILLFGVLFFMFQAVFAWASVPMDMIDGAAVNFGGWVGARLPDGWLKDLFVEGVIAGVGSVVVFLPQILILFAFILMLEGSGYMARAAFLMDSLMMRVGLNGRAFIPLLSSFACAIPGIMAARVIESERDRLTTILIAPLMTCSARLPVYAVLIAAFIPSQLVGPFNLQGLVMFGLYFVGVVSAVLVAFILKKTVARGRTQPLLMELPTYKLPDPRDVAIGLYLRAMAFLKRAGTIILATSILLWFLASYPASAGSLRETFAGRVGSFLEWFLAPIGFNLEISIALVPGMAAREVAVSALGTVYAVQNAEENNAGLAAVLQSAWTLPTALAFLTWYVFAPQCFATLAAIRRETNSWRWTGFAFAYLMGLAYVMAGLTYWTAQAVF